jgi:hypothetical protein
MSGKHYTRISFDLPVAAMQAVNSTPDAFARALRLAAAMFWYSRGEVSQEQCAAIAGLDRTDFLLALGAAGQDFAVVDFDDLDRELARARAARTAGASDGA